MSGRSRPRPPRSFSPTAQTIVAALGGVVAVSLCATLLLAPKGGLIAVAPADQADWFTRTFIERADAFRGAQSWIALAASLLMVVVPVVLAVRLRRRLADERGALRSVLIVVLVALAALVVVLPFEFWLFRRASDVGLVVQSSGSWFGDKLLASLILLAGVLLLALFCRLLLRRLPRAWWALLALTLVVLSAGWLMLSPVLVDPLFAEFTPLREGPLAAEVEKVAAAAGVDPGKVFTVDSAQRTTGANAYVTGLGPTGRVVLYETLKSDFTSGEREAVIAHELGHLRHHDLRGGLIWFAVLAFASLFATDRLLRRLREREGLEPASSAGLVIVLAAALVAVAVSQPAANAYSRAVEFRADRFALEVTQRPDLAIALERRPTIQNLSRPEPPALLQLLAGTHPTPVQRIGQALDFTRSGGFRGAAGP